MVAIVALRLGIGFHFFQEGFKKFTPGFTSEYFLRPAKGPLAEIFIGMVPDPYGEKRLDYQTTEEAWTKYRDRVIRDAQLEGKDKARAEAITKEYLARYQYLLDSNEEAIEKYHIKLAAWKAAKQGDTTSSLDYRRDWLAKESLELRGMAMPWLAQIKQLREQYRMALLTEAVGYENPSARTLHIPDPTDMPLINNMVKWTVILVGIGCLLGLFTRFWCVIGAGFLMSVIVSQFPGYHGAMLDFLYYQIVEILAFGVLFAAAAGRCAGLDFFVHRGMTALLGGAKKQEG